MDGHIVRSRCISKSAPSPLVNDNTSPPKFSSPRHLIKQLILLSCRKQRPHRQPTSTPQDPREAKTVSGGEIEIAEAGEAARLAAAPTSPQSRHSPLLPQQNRHPSASLQGQAHLEGAEAGAGAVVGVDREVDDLPPPFEEALLPALGGPLEAI